MLPPPLWRRLNSSLHAAFDQACRQGEIDAAGALLRILELAMRSRFPDPSPERRLCREQLIRLGEQLWELRQAERAPP